MPPTPWRSKSPENDISAWIRRNEYLAQTHACLNIMDQDLWIHKYMCGDDKGRTREVHLINFIEIKQFGREPTPAQAELMNLLAQMFRHWRKVNRNTLLTASLSKKQVQVIPFKSLLRLERKLPGGGWMEWSSDIGVKRRITVNELEDVLLFRLRPDSLKKAEWLRSHHVRKNGHGTTPPLFGGLR